MSHDEDIDARLARLAAATTRLTLKRDELRASLTPALLRDTARKYLDQSRYVQVRLLPES